MATLDGRCVLVYDIGGSHISAAVCAESDFALGPVSKATQPQSIDAFFDALSQLASQATAGVCGVAGTVLAMPGPFDYLEGVSWMRHKMPYLYGVNVRCALAKRLGWKDEQVQFLNDAAAFLLGEIGTGAARGISRTVGITLGTGIGSAFAIDGHLVTEGPGVPHGGEIWNLPFEDGIVEDLISTRSIQQGYKECTGNAREVAEIAAGAAQDPAAVEVFQELGRDLGRVLRILLHDFAPEVVVIAEASRTQPIFFCPLPIANFWVLRFNCAFPFLVTLLRWWALGFPGSRARQIRPNNWPPALRQSKSELGHLPPGGIICLCGFYRHVLFSVACRLVLRLRLRGKGVDNLAGPGIVQLFARLMLNCIGIGLQPLHMAVQPRIFLLEIQDLLAKLMIFDALLLPGRKTVLPIDDAPSEKQDQRNCNASAGGAPDRLRRFERTLSQHCKLDLLVGSCGFCSAVRHLSSI